MSPMNLLKFRLKNSLDSQSLPDRGGILKDIRRKVQTKTYGFLGPLEDAQLLTMVEELSASLKERFKSFVILGTGGSSLGGKTVCALRHNPFTLGQHPLFFVDNVDPSTFKDLLATLDLTTTGFISISKSGTTAETLCQTLCVAHVLEEKGLPLSHHFVVITEERPSPLRLFAEHYKIPTYRHDPSIGGRFSVFSLVGLLPAALKSIQIRDLLHGAKSILQDFLTLDTPPALEGAEWAYAAMQSSKSMAVMMPYLDRLDPFAQWYCQLWAESLGKNGLGSTPVRALGTVDQHSQLQLYHDGPQDKTFTFLVEKAPSFESRPLLHPSFHQELAYLQDHSMKDLLIAEAAATMDSLAYLGCPVRLIEFNVLDEKILGALLMHFMLETIVTAAFMKVNPFDQPGVEQSKILTRQYLQKG